MQSKPVIRLETLESKRVLHKSSWRKTARLKQVGIEILDATNNNVDGTRETEMWIIFGIGTIVATILNILMTVKHRDASYCRFASMSLTALIVCAFYYEEAQRVINAEWGALMDIMPYMSKVLWSCVLISIFVNSISLIKPAR